MKLNIKVSIIIVFFCLLLIPTSLALNTEQSNESIQAEKLLNQAEKDIFEMISKNISVLSVNETYQEAAQLYSAQMALEEKGNKANYKLIIEYTSKISAVKKVAIEANDELEIFKKNYEDAKKEANLSDMQEEYNQIILSFNEERFEDTLTLIKNGYDRISEIQSSQTVANAFYLATSKSIKEFFIRNGLKILIICVILFLILLIFWSTLTKIRRRIKLNNLIMQKKAINGLIKEIQGSYFKSRKMSETEYKIKLKNYEEFIRDIERQIMILNEKMFKIKIEKKKNIKIH